jgi:hypothetical protein
MLRSRGLHTSILMAITLLGCTTPVRAQGFVEHVEPPVLERGKTTRVTLVGSQLGKPVGLWTSMPAGAVTAKPVAPSSAHQAVLDVTVAGDAPVGVFGLRLATEDGLANACLLLIDDLLVRASPQPQRLESVKVQMPVALWGRFREAAVDRYLIDVPAGARVAFEAVGNRLGKDVDPLITIRDAGGKIVTERDNDAGLYFDFRFAHTFAEAGTYTVELRDARFHGSEHAFYVLRMGKFPATRVALPMAIHWSKRFPLRLPGLDPLIADRSPTQQEERFAVTLPQEAEGMFFGVVKRKGDDGSAWLPMEASDATVTVHQAAGTSFAEGMPAKAPGMWCGILGQPRERHFYRVELTKGQKIQVRAEARAFNSPADLEIALVDPQGKELRRVGENLQTQEIVLDFTAGAPGVYGVMVRDINLDGGPAFGYRLDVGTPRPTIQVTADVEGLTVPRGYYQTVPLTATRTDYTGPIALTLIGAPPGVTLTPSEIGAGAGAIVCKLAATPDTPLGIHTLQIRATPLGVTPVGVTPVGVTPVGVTPVGVTPVGEPGASATGGIVRTHPLLDRQIVNVDLIPHALREDQLRLPPSLTDRFALQVTPPSFFTFELPEPRVTLGRYQHADFPLAVTRAKGFDGPIAFGAKGGQLAPKEEGRTRVYAEFTESKGSIHSKILTNLAKHRVDVSATGVAPDGRRVTLTRTLDLDIRAAYVVTAEPAVLKLEPGATAKLRWNVERMTTFDGAVTVAVDAAAGIELPASVVIPRGQAGVAIDVKIYANLPAGRRSINWNASAVVNGLEEEQRGRVEIDIVKSVMPKP